MTTRLLKCLILLIYSISVTSFLFAQETTDNSTYYYNNFETAAAGNITSLGAASKGNANRISTATTIDASTASPLDGSVSLASIKPATNAIGAIRWNFVGNGTSGVDLTQNDWEWDFVYTNNSTLSNDDPDQMAVGNNSWRYWLYSSTYNGNKTQGFYISHVGANLVLRYRYSNGNAANQYNTILTTPSINNQTSYIIKVQRLKNGSWAIYMDPFVTGMTTAQTIATSTTSNTGSGFSTYYYSYLEATATTNARFQWDDFNMYTRVLQFTAVGANSVSVNNITPSPLYPGQTNVIMYGLKIISRGNFNINQIVFGTTGAGFEGYFNGTGTLYKTTNPFYSIGTATAVTSITLTGNAAQNYGLQDYITTSGNTDGTYSNPGYYFLTGNVNSTLNYGNPPTGTIAFTGLTTLIGNSDGNGTNGSSALNYTTNGNSTGNTMTFLNAVVPPTASNVSGCGPGSYTITASGGNPAGGTYNWYAAASGGSALQSSTSTTYAPTVTSTTTYYVSYTVGGATSTRTAVSVTINPVPASTFTATSPVIVGSNSTITYTGSDPASSTYNWNFNGGTTVSGSGRGPYTIQWSTPGSKSVTLSVTNASGCTSPVTTQTIMVQPVAPTATGGSGCGTGTVTLSAAGTPTGGTYNWYAASSGGSALQSSTSATYITPVISTTTTYYVSYTSGGIESTRTAVTATINPVISSPYSGAAFSYSFSGNTNDVSGNANNGINTGGATLTTDRFGAANSAYNFNGSSQYISSTASVNNPNVFTLSLWFNTTTAGGKLLGFGSSQTGASGSYDRHIYMSNSGQLYYGIYQSNNVYVINTTASYNDGNWHHVVVTMGTDGSTLYVDGTVQASNASMITGQNFAGYWRIGYDNFGTAWPNYPSNSYFSGKLDDIAVYNTELSAAQIASSNNLNQIGALTAVCAGSPITFNSPTITGATYTWHDSGSGSQTGQNPTFPSAVAGNYTLTVTGGPGGCSSTATITPTINAGPVITYSTPQTYTAGAAITNLSPTVSGGTPSSYSVSPALPAGLSFSTTTGVISGTATVAAPATNYVVTATLASGCTGAATVNITVKPASPTATGGSVCGSGTVTLTASGGNPAGGTYNWYAASSGGTALQSSTAATYTTPSISATTTYYVSYTSSTVESTRTAVTATVNPVPVIAYATPQTYTVGTAITNLSPASSGAAPSGYAVSPALPAGLSLSTTTGIISGTATVAAAATNYIVTATTASGCTGMATVNITVAPAAPTATGGSTCGPGTVTLTASGGNPTGGTYNWYAASSGGTALQSSTATTYTTASISSTTTYYVSYTSSGSESALTTVTATVNPVPTSTFTAASPVNVGSNSTITFTGTYAASSTYSWNFNGGTVVSGSGVGPYTVQWAIPGAKTVSLLVTNSVGCTSSSTQPVSVIPAAPTATGGSSCGTGAVTLTASGTPSGGTYNWYAGSTGGTALQSSTSATYNANVLVTTTYYVSYTSGGVESSRTPVTATINPIVTSPISNASFEYPFNGNANDISGNNNTGHPTYTSPSTTAPTLSADRYGAASSAYTFDGQGQYIYTTTQYTNPQIFTLSLWFNTTTTSGGKLIGFDTNQPGPNSGQFDRHIYMNNFGQLYYGVYNSGVYTINSANSYNDGVWHHVVVTFGTTYGSVMYVDGVQVAANSAMNAAEPDNGYWRIGGDLLSGWPSTHTSNYFAGQIDDIGVYSSELSAAQVASANNLNLIGATGPVCASSPITLYGPDITGATFTWQDPAGTTIVAQNPTFTAAVAGAYTLTVTGGPGGCSSTATITPNILVTPVSTFTATSPVTVATNSTITYSGTYVSSSTYTWNFNSGTVVTGSGVGPYTVQWSTPGTKTISLIVTSVNGCSSTSTQTVIVQPAAPTATGGSTCGPGTVTLTASGGSPTGGTYNWYAASSGGTALQSSTAATYTTPSISSTTTYYVSYTSSTVESSRTAVTATVNPLPVISYTTPQTYTVGTAITALSPTVSGGTPTGYSVSPALPAGLSFNTTTGTISGTATVAAAAANYTVTATTASGCTGMATINIMVTPPAPTATGGSTCGPGTVTLTASGGNPSGGTYNWYGASSGGTALQSSTATTYTTPSISSTTTYYVSYTSSTVESSRTAVAATVNPVPVISYATPQTYTVGTAITSLSPSSSGATPSGYAISPALPAGLSFSATTGAISGTATVAAAAANYTVTAISASGCTGTAIVNITVQPAAPTATGGSTCGPGTVTLTASGGSPTGGTYNWYAASSGGTALQSSTATTYTTASISTSTTYYVSYTSNGSESVRTAVTATVNPVPTSAFTATSPVNVGSNSTLTFTGTYVASSTYTYNLNGGTIVSGSGTGPYTVQWSTPGTKTVSLMVTNSAGCTSTSAQTVTVMPIAPTATGGSTCGPGTVTLTASGGSPTGGTYNWYAASSGGTALQSSTATTYTIPSISATTTYYVSYTSAGVESSRTAVIATVNPLPVIFYATPQTYTVGTAITSLSPTVSGGTPTSYSVSPALPAGLSLSTTTGAISGTATVAAAAANYTVTATTASGCTGMATVNITVKPPTPTAAGGSACGPGTVTLTASGGNPSGGTYNWYTASSGGAALQSSTAATYITPSISSTTTYYVSYTSSTVESSRTAVTATVNPLPVISYTTPQTYIVGTAITASSPTVSGGTPTSYSVSPALPSGLSLSTTTGAISGTATVAAASANYTVTATTGAGCTGMTTVNITVKPPAPTATGGSTCGPGTVTLTASGGNPSGGTYNWYAASSGGTALQSSTATTYTTPSISATTTYYVSYTSSSVESSRTAVTATVNSLPVISYTTPQTYTVGTAITALSPSVSGGTPASYSVSPALPAGLSLSTTTGAISGTATVAAAAANYTVTATTGAGCTGMTTVNITVTPPAPTATAGSTCGPGTVALTASGGNPSGGTYNWYAASSGGTALQSSTAATYTTPSISASTTYYASYTSNSVESSRTAVTATVNPVPTSTFTATSPVSVGSNSAITFTGTYVSSSTYTYNFNGGTVVSGSGVGPYNVQWSTPGTKTVSLLVTNSAGCTSSTQQSVTVMPSVPTATAGSSCGTGTVSLTASGTPSGGTYNWYAASSGGTALQSSTSASYNANILVTATYYVSYTSGGVESTRTPVVATINPIVSSPYSGVTFSYPFSGNTNDISGNGNNGIATGSPALSTDRFGAANSAYNFNGSSQYISSTASASNLNVFTLSVWFNTTTGGGKLLGFGSSQTGSSIYYDRHIYMSNSGQLYYGIKQSNTMLTINTAASYNDGNWHHVIVTMGPDGSTLYVDGTVQASNALMTAGQNFTGYWRIGYDNFGTAWPNYPSDAYFTGKLDDIAVYYRELSAAEIASSNNLNQVGYTSSGCAGNQITFTAPSITGATYSWTDGTTTVTGQNATFASMGTGNYTLTVTGGPGSCSSTATITPAVPTYTWTGSASTDPTNANNWTYTTGSLPNTLPPFDGTGSLVIPNGLTNYPVLTANESVFSLNIASGAKFSLNGYTLNVGCNIYNSSNVAGGGILYGNNNSSQITWNGTLANQSYNGTTTAGSGQTGNMTVNNSAGGTVTIAGGGLDVYNTLTMIKGNLAVGASPAALTLKSSAAQSASVAAIPAGSTITGNVTVERFVTGGATKDPTTGRWTYRSYRLMSSPVNEGADGSGNYPYSLNYLAASTIITDVTSTYGTTAGNPSLYVYNEGHTPSNATFTSGTFDGVTDISETTAAGTITTTDPAYPTGKLYAGDGFMMYFRGDNINSLSGVPSKTKAPFVAPENVVFSTTGNLNQGTYSVTPWTGTAGLMYTTTNPGNAPVRGYNLAGNPYASSIDWSLFSNSNPGAAIYGHNVNPSIYLLNPRTSNYDVYSASTGISTGNASNVIPSGAGFYVQANNSSPTLTFTEAAKTSAQVTGNNLLMGRPDNQTAYKSYMRLKLVTDTVNYDDMVIGFNSSSTMKYNPAEDAKYIGLNAIGTIAGITDDSVKATVKWLPLPKASEERIIPLNVTGKTSGIHTLERTDLKQLPEIYEVWLMDKYKSDSLDIKHNTTYAFNLDLADTASYGSNRFKVVIRQDPALAIHLLNFTAAKASNGAQLVWKTENEQDYTSFTVERSTDNGKTFQVLGGLNSAGQGTYSFLDKDPQPAVDQYRLEIQDLDGTISYSKVIPLMYSSLSNNIAASGITIYPNPATSNVNLYIVNTAATTANSNVTYNITVVNSTGTVIKTEVSATPTWQYSVGSLIPGTYMIQVVNNIDKSLVGKGKFVKL